MAKPEKASEQTDPAERDVVLSALFMMLARQNQHLRKEATRDSLTGLLNRRGLDKVLANDRPPRAMLHADSTNLKRVNDALGHDRGDEAIVATARVLQASLRPSDIIARIGGDEFMVLLDAERRRGTEPMTSQELLDAVKSRIGEETASLTAQPENTDLVTAGFNIAVGGAVWQEGMSIEQLRADSDADMYRAKEAQHAASGMGPRQA